MPVSTQPAPTISRSMFMFLVVACGIVIPTFFVLTKRDGALAELVSRELLSLALATVVIYFTGSVVERQNVLARLVDRSKPKPAAEPEG